MSEKAARHDVCSGCGLPVAGGDEGCQALFESVGLRGFADPRFGRLHRMVVDIYALQHPARYCISAKSLAAHLCGLCELVERGGDTALPNMSLQRWLNGSVDIAKPGLPESRGALTIAGIAAVDSPVAYAQAVGKWADAVWLAYAPLHPLARDWLDRALSAGSPKQRHGHT